MAKGWVCFSLLYVITCQLCCSSSHSASSTSGWPSVESQFARHRTFRPSVYHGREKRQLSHTQDKDGHVNELSIVLPLESDSYILDLRLHRELLPDGYFEKYSEDGREVLLRRSPNGVGGTTSGRGLGDQLCHYQGQVRHVPHSWVALSTCAGLSGAIFDGKELHYVEPTRNGSSLDDEHLLLKHSDLTLNLTCGTQSALPHSSHTHPKVKRSMDMSDSYPVRGPFKANSRSRYVELVLVVDNKSYENHEKDLKRVFRRCKDIANIVNALYAPLNIFVALVGIVVWTEKDDIQLSVKGDETLTNFLHYRRVRLSKEHPNDNAQLLTGIQFQGGVVGKALKGPMCTYEFSGGVAMDHSPSTGLVATTVAHEMGHNFGMEHDNDTLCHCPDDKCIMAASSSAVSPTRWSSCSLENLALAFEHGMDYCLRNKPQKLFESPECGNMFVEEGEECDCGLPDHCTNPCCDPHTCKLHVNATCAIGECCDLTTCRVKNAGMMCRSALQECDLPEYCTGASEFCPGDLFKMDGLSCGQDKAYCYQGSCRSHSDQCRLLWGPSGKGSDAQCYKQNVHGNKTGNCGYTKPNETFVKCLDENINCGLLHCSHLNERLEFGMESVAILSHSFFNVDGKIIPCRTANVDLGLQDVDPGLVPNGAKCGHNKMCVNQTCVPVSSVVKAGCPRNCNYNGECNNLGKCHCKVGFAPPFCDYPGPGGSLDGGPASDPNVRNTFVVAMFIIFLGIVPILAILFCCWYFCRDRRQRAQLWAKIQGGPKLSLPTRGSPDMTQPPSSSNSSTTSSPSRRNPFHHRRLFWPVTYLWGNKARPVPAEDPSAPRRNGTAGPKVEISRPLPLRPTGTTAGASGAQAPTSSFASSLVGQYNGFTLSPLKEQADSSFDSADATVPASAPKSNGVQQQPKKPNSSGIVAARASFFSNGPTAPAASTTSVPVRPAPAAPITKAADPAPVHPPGHVEITITKTIVAADNPTEKIVIKEVIKPMSPQKTRPLSTPNAYSVKSLFSRADPQPNAPPHLGGSSTLQKVASIFKPSPAQHVLVSVPESAPMVSEAKEAGKPVGSTLPRQQSIKAAKINRESLRQLEISNPIPQNAIEMPTKVVPVRPAPAPPTAAPAAAASPTPPPLPAKVAPLSPTAQPSKLGISSTLPRLPKGNKVHFADEKEEEKSETDGKATAAPLPAVVERSESMRMRGVTSRPNIPQFGSMRGKRPVSMPFARPTSPPPRPPGASASAISPVMENDYPYDDCSRADRTGEEEGNIYASIEELEATGPLLKKDETGSTTTSNSDGLLSEIVTELKKKNLDEMYSVTVPKKPLPAVPSSAGTAAVTSKPAVVTPSSTATTTSKSSAPLSMSILAASNASKPSVPATATTSAPAPVTSSSTSQGYKPYSSAWRSRYTSTPSTTSTTATVSTTQPTPKLSTFSSPSTVATSAAVTTTSATQSTPKLSTFTTSPPTSSAPSTTASSGPKLSTFTSSAPSVPPATSVPSATTSSAPKLSTFASSSAVVPSTVRTVSPVPLPAVGPVGKVPTNPPATTTTTGPSVITSSDKKPAVALPATSSSDSSKKPTSPERSKPPGGAGVLSSATANSAASATVKSKPINSKTVAGAIANKSAPGGPKAVSVPKVVSKAPPTKPTTTSTSAGSSASTSSLGSASTASSSGTKSGPSSTASSSSLVHSMQQKFDTSSKPTVGKSGAAAATTPAAGAQAAKGKVMPKR